MTLLLLQMTAVLLTTLLCGSIARALGQSRVIGEIIGGIALGPSLLGRVAPQFAASLFPPNSLGAFPDAFDVLSTVGLILFMFFIGCELNFEHLRRNRSTATLASALSILLPFGMAVAVAPLLRSRFAPAGVGSLPFALFLGICLSITAVPVLARILDERQMQSTPLGTTALVCAAVGDVTAWILLAAALTLVPHSEASMSLAGRVVWLGIYLIAMLGVIRPLGKWIAKRNSHAQLSYEALGLALILLLASAAATEAIGLHPLFGAFLAGVCFPRNPQWQHTVRARLETVVSVLLLPFFFALTGMRTRLDLLSGVTIWSWTALVLILAVAGKMGGAVVAARLTGQSWQNAWALGALLNTRGLVELIVLNIAYNAHVFSPTLFTMLVVMALITTMMTTPILNLLGIQKSSQQNKNRATAEII
jgi:Kef-type K+ transport system membrane component KefB